MFVDRVRVKMQGGGGGNGCCSFRREKYVPLGGPDGGDGGKGGDVYLEATTRMQSLLDLRYQPHWRGDRGEHGKGSDCHGKSGADTIVSVPCGSAVYDAETGELCADLVEPGQQFLAARGGRGGKGNPRFATSTNRAPRFAEQGEPGESRAYRIELKVLADAGLVGLPNAGKSTFLSAATAAKPKIGDYPFTTLSPNLGVAYLSRHRTLTLADIPGIIEGAAEGKGLGHDFLRHIERTRVLLFLVDLGDENPAATLEVLQEELRAYSSALADRPRLIAFNKADIPENRARFETLRTEYPGAFLVSAAVGEGVPEVLAAIWDAVEAGRAGEAAAEAERDEAARNAPQTYTYEAPFEIVPADDGYEITGAAVVRAVQMTNFDNPEAVRHLQKRFQRMGLFNALKRAGAEPGQTIRIADMELEYQPER